MPSRRDAGGRALIVGGWVRDRLLLGDGHSPTTSTSKCSACRPIACARCSNPFGRVEAVGESFQVYKIGDIDVSLPRRESKAGRGHRGFVVTGDPDMSIEEAARRRDFTVNAISWDPLTGEYFDPFDGRARSRAPAPARGRSATPSPTTACACCARCSSPRASTSRSTKRPRDCAAESRSTICRPSASGASSKSCCSRRGRRSASRSRWISASSQSCFRSCRRWPAARRSPSGIRKATSGCTRCR